MAQAVASQTSKDQWALREAWAAHELDHRLVAPRAILGACQCMHRVRMARCGVAELSWWL